MTDLQTSLCVTDAGSDDNATIRLFTSGEMAFALCRNVNSFRAFRKFHPDFPRRALYHDGTMFYDVRKTRDWLVSRGFDIKFFDLRVAQILTRPAPPRVRLKK
ncbi:hypothetical protein [Methylosinus sp. LW4]|uniref:hypothetical protein n=1 Tax=Methylosinus sp. LW4 TaxID=136993 RepID=UPI000374C266|nr:hypothetical protein [Methylosinus sp. LW4]